MSESSEVATPAAEIPAVPAGGSSTPAPSADTAPAQGAPAPATETLKDAPPDGAAPTGDKPGDADTEARKQRQRTNRLYREIAQERVRRENAERQLQALQQPPKTPDPSEPKAADFTDIEDYNKAIRKHEREVVARETAESQRTTSIQTLQRTAVEKWTAAVAKGEDSYPDFYEKVGDLTPTSDINIAIMNADNGADVVYHLATHREELMPILSMPAALQGAAIGRLSARLAAEPPKVASISNAPTPIKPVGGATKTTGTIRDNMPYNEFVAIRNKQLGRK